DDDAGPLAIVAALVGAGDLVDIAEGLSFETALERESGSLSLSDIEVNKDDGRIRGDLILRTGADPELDASVQLTRLRIDEGWLEVVNKLYENLATEYGFAGSLEVSGSALELGSKIIRQLDLNAAIEPGVGLRVTSLNATTTDGTALQLEGLVSEREGQLGLRGSVRLSGPSLRELIQEFGVSMDRVVSNTLQSFELQSYIDFEAQRFRFQGASLQVDTTEINGSLAIIDNDRLTVALSAAVDRLVPDAYLSTDLSWAALWEALNTSVASARETDIAAEITVDLVTFDQVRLRNFTLRGSVENGQLTLADLGFSSLADSRAQLVGTADLNANDYDLAIEASAEDPALLLRSFGLSIPATLSEFGPLRLDGTTRRSASGDDVELALTGPELNVELAGTVGSWKLLDSHRIRIEGRVDDPRSLATALGAGIVARDLPFGPLQWQGISEDLLGVHGVVFEMDMGETSVAGELEFDDQADPPRVAGFVVGDAFPEELFALLRRELAQQASASLGLGDWALGRWTNSPIQLPLAIPAQVNLLARAESFRSSTGQPIAGGQVLLAIDNDNVALSDIIMPLGNASLTGSVNLSTHNGVATLTTEVQLDDVATGDLLDLSQSPLDFPERLDISLGLSGQGASLAALVDASHGNGQLRLGQQTTDLVVTDGIVVSSPPLDLRFDLYAWVVDAVLEQQNGARVELLGTPDNLSIRTIEPNDADTPSR
ncbi:MAG: hypothetical protein AAFY56_19880, partial [Pseudomonadota bacterium]